MAPSASRLPRWLLAALALYFATMALQASLLAPSGRSDDVESLLLSQSLAWGYQSKNPPAFYWLAWAATQAAGPGLPVIYALRLAGVFAAFAGLYAIARRLQPDPWLAAGAGLAMLATLHFHWYLLFYLTNTTLAMALAPAAVLALLHLRDRPTPASYALFGAVLAAGILTRYNYAIFAAALLGAALTLPAWRARLLRPAALVSLAVLLLLLAPHVAWVVRHWSVLSGQVEGQIIGPEAPPHARRVLEGLANLAEASLSILVVPLGILLALLLPQVFRRIPVADPDRAVGLALLARLLAFSLGFVLLYIAAGSSYVKPHHLFFLAFAPLWLIARLDAARLARWRPRAFAAGLAACAVLAAVAYPLVNRADARRCGACEEFQPLAEYAAALRAAGFERGTVIALSRRQDFPTAALRGAFPNARFLSFDYPLFAPPPGRAPGGCLLVWSGASEWPPVWAGAPDTPVPGLDLPLPSDAHVGAAGGLVHLSDRPAQGIRFVLIREGLGDCR